MGKYLDIYIDGFHQDILTINDSFIEAINEAISSLTKNEKLNLKIELEEIFLNRDIKFSEIWNESSSPFKLRNEKDARDILGDILSLL